MYDIRTKTGEGVVSKAKQYLYPSEHGGSCVNMSVDSHDIICECFSKDAEWPISLD